MLIPFILQASRGTFCAMKKRLVVAATLLFCGIIVAGLPGRATAQTSYTTHLQGLDVVMSLDRTNVIVGEPVILNITMINTSGMPATELRANFQLPPGNGVELNVQPPGELEYRYLGPLEVGTYLSAPMNILATRPESVSVLLLFDRSQPNGLLFSKPGTYTISGSFRLNLQKDPNFSVAELPPTRITVSEATGNDAKVLELLGDPATMRAIHLGIAPTTATLTKISEAAKLYPRTALGALALKAEGLQYVRSETPAERTRGAALLQQYLENDILYSDGDQVAWEIAAGYHKNKQYELAREWVFWLLRRYPHSARIQATDALMYFYYYQPAAFTLTTPWFLLKQPWIVPGVEPPADLKPRAGSGDQ